jgi:hypothetical protein
LFEQVQHRRQIDLSLTQRAILRPMRPPFQSFKWT